MMSFNISKFFSKAFLVFGIAIYSFKGMAQGAKPLSFSQLLKQEDNWYKSSEAIRIADNFLLYQHTNGGWLKNIDMIKVLTAEEVKAVTDQKNEEGTCIDNGATFSQLHFLQMVYSATREEKYKASILKGIDFLVAAQYETGGWPQFYPIRKGYYEHITYNDGAMIGAMRLLRDAALSPRFLFVDQQRKKRASIAIAKGLDVILKTQITRNGKLTAWCAQHDRVTFQPQKARAYELISISGNESVGIVRYLMEIEKPSPEVIKAVESAISWFNEVKIEGKSLVRKEDKSLPKGFDLVLSNDPAASPIWARFYDIATNKPMFVGRDGVVKDDLSEIEYERRVGYGYLTDLPNNLLQKDYPSWKKRLEKTR